MDNGVSLVRWLLVIGGAFGLGATRLGWFDRGGLMRRMDWFDFYGALEQIWVDGNVRHAMYLISACLFLIGVVLWLA